MRGLTASVLAEFGALKRRRLGQRRIPDEDAHDHVSALPATEAPILTTPITLSGGTFSALPTLLSFSFLPPRLLTST
jgi:hypothetical protein